MYHLYVFPLTGLFTERVNDSSSQPEAFCTVTEDPETITISSSLVQLPFVIETLYVPASETDNVWFEPTEEPPSLVQVNSSPEPVTPGSKVTEFGAHTPLSAPKFGLEIGQT